MLVMLAAVLIPPTPAAAQTTTKDTNKLSKELVIPIGPHWVIDSYLNIADKDGDLSDESATSME